MSDPKKDAKDEASEPKKGKGKLVMIVAIVVVLVGGGVGAFFALGKSSKSEEAGAEGEEHGDGGGEHGEGGGEHGAEGAALAPAVLPLETFIVNLQVKGSFLRTTIQLEFAEPELPHTVESDVPKIKDSIIKILSNKSSAELLTSEGKEKARSEIRDGVNEVLGSEDVTQVFFTEFIIQ
jgi:flagellar FliL protein